MEKTKIVVNSLVSEALGYDMSPFFAEWLPSSDIDGARWEECVASAEEERQRLIGHPAYSECLEVAPDEVLPSLSGDDLPACALSHALVALGVDYLEATLHAADPDERKVTYHGPHGGLEVGSYLGLDDLRSDAIAWLDGHDVEVVERPETFYLYLDEPLFDYNECQVTLTDPHVRARDYDPRIKNEEWAINEVAIDTGEDVESIADVWSMWRTREMFQELMNPLEEEMCHNADMLCCRGLTSLLAQLVYDTRLSPEVRAHASEVASVATDTFDRGYWSWEGPTHHFEFVGGQHEWEESDEREMRELLDFAHLVVDEDEGGGNRSPFHVQSLIQ